MNIHVNSPAYRGAPWPKFNAKMVNERRFEDELRCKEAWLELDKAKGEGNVKWLSQESSYSSKKFDAEVIRAFKANGAPIGMDINIEFGSRDDGTCQVYHVTVK